MSKSPSWSYSSIKQFQTCPTQYYHLRVKKDFVEPSSPALRYGNRFHKSAEHYVGEGKPLPPEFAFAQHLLDRLASMRGTVLPERKFALDANLEPCQWRSKQAWWRGIVDLLVVNKEHAKIVDYKTGKSTKYADKGQLELMALATFKHFPEVKHVKAGLLFVIPNEFITAQYTIEDVPGLWQKWLTSYGDLHKAHRMDTWHPNPSGLCKAHCIVTSCIHNGKNT